MYQLPVRHIMTPRCALRCMSHDEPLEHLRALLAFGLHHVPVLEGPRLVGVLTAATLLRLPPHDLDTPCASVAAAYPFISPSPDHTIADAALLLTQHPLASLPIVDAQDHLVGLVTAAELLRAFVGAAA